MENAIKNNLKHIFDLLKEAKFIEAMDLYLHDEVTLQEANGEAKHGKAFCIDFEQKFIDEQLAEFVRYDVGNYAVNGNHTNYSINCRIYFVYFRMAKYAELQIKEELIDLKKLLLKYRGERTRKRIRAIISLKEKTFETRQGLADDLKVHIRTLERWVNKYKNDGLQVLIQKETRQKVSKFIDAESYDLLSNKLNDAKNPLLSYVEALEWFNKETGQQIKYQNLRYHIRRHFKSKLKVPRKSHVKKDVEAEQAFLKTA